jgi:hypothetical protein
MGAQFTINHNAAGWDAADQDASSRNAPCNLHLSNVVSGRERLKERMEHKYFIPPQGAASTLALLRRVCRYDPEFPQEQINSLYFDSPDLDQHERSLAGDRFRSKIRIRWYGDRVGPHALPGGKDAASACKDPNKVRVWVELKSRIGFASTKQRRIVKVAAERLALPALREGILAPCSLEQIMAEFGFSSPKRLCPVVVISYWRHRFVEPRTGVRASLDSHIRSTVVMPGLGRGERGLELAGAVLEVKGADFVLPASLLSISSFGSSWTRFSKYSASLDAHLDGIDGASRLWPSGTMAHTAGLPLRLRAPAHWLDSQPREPEAALTVETN